MLNQFAFHTNAVQGNHCHHHYHYHYNGTFVMYSICMNYVAVVEVLLYFLSFFHFCDRLLKCKMNPKENSVMFLIHTMCYSTNSSQWSGRDSTKMPFMWCHYNTFTHIYILTCTQLLYIIVHIVLEIETIRGTSSSVQLQDEIEMLVCNIELTTRSMNKLPGTLW